MVDYAHPESAAFLEEFRKALFEKTKHKDYDRGVCGRPGKFSYRQIGKRCGVSEVPIHHFVNGNRLNPGLWLAIRLANELGIDLGEIQRRFKKQT